MDERQEILKAQAERMANFCIGTGVQPSEYRQLTLRQIQAFTAEANKRKG